MMVGFCLGLVVGVIGAVVVPVAVELGWLLWRGV
jgi:hypothetical protein